jgi:hypothetical protein
MQIPGIPEDVIDYLFNVHEGASVDRYCSRENQITTQVAISYSELLIFSRHEPGKIVGRIMNMMPGAGFFLGKPTLCRCGTINR